MTSQRHSCSGTIFSLALAAGRLRPSLDHLIRPLQERRRDREAESLGGLRLEFVGLLDGQVSGLGALEEPVLRCQVNDTSLQPPGCPFGL